MESPGDIISLGAQIKRDEMILKYRKGRLFDLDEQSRALRTAIAVLEIRIAKKPNKRDKENGDSVDKLIEQKNTLIGLLEKTSSEINDLTKKVEGSLDFDAIRKEVGKKLAEDSNLQN